MNRKARPQALIVDDDLIVIMSIRETLEDAGYHTLEASNVDAAKVILDDFADGITLMITDVRMPGSIDGVALARQVDERWPHINIIIASGRAQPDKSKMPINASFLGKPFTRTMVLNQIANMRP